jgi:hypothetical protein
MVMFQCRDITLDRLANIQDRFFAGSSLTDTPWKAGTFHHKALIFSRIDNYLPHCQLRSISTIQLIYSLAHASPIVLSGCWGHTKTALLDACSLIIATFPPKGSAQAWPGTSHHSQRIRHLRRLRRMPTFAKPVSGAGLTQYHHGNTEDMRKNLRLSRFKARFTAMQKVSYSIVRDVKLEYNIYIEILRRAASDLRY